MPVCPYCQVEMDDDLDTCPNCGITMIYFFKCQRCGQEFATTGTLKFCPLCDADLSEQMN